MKYRRVKIGGGTYFFTDILLPLKGRKSTAYCAKYFYLRPLQTELFRSAPTPALSQRERGMDVQVVAVLSIADLESLFFRPAFADAARRGKPEPSSCLD